MENAVDLPFRLFDCFLLAVPLAWAALEASLFAARGVASIVGPPGDLSTSEGDGTMTVSAICHDK